MIKTFNITTFGCQMNEHDSETISGILKAKGFLKVNSNKEANIVIFNTCSIRENADKRFFGTLGQLKKRKEEEKENFIVCVCGCMMQQEHIINTIKQKYPWIDIIFGTHNIDEFSTLLDNRIKTNKKQISIYPDRKGITEGLPCDRLYKFKSYVNIMYGCNNFCSYCIVPYTRGRERSRDKDEILKEIIELSKDGVKEVMLLGQNVNSYKCDDGYTFANLIKDINKIDGIERIRFMSSHPKDLSDELIDCFRTCEKLSHYFHLPMQSGSSKVLKEMNRRYDKEKFISLANKLREVCPDIAISTDIIVGFPGETEEDFLDTLDVCENVRFDSAFTFIYSKRNGTPASIREDQVDEETCHRRFDKLVDTINRISAEKNAEYLNRICDVLVEGPSKRNSLTYGGRTDTFKLVNFKGTPDLIGKIVKVKITSTNTFSLEGEIVND